ncbi:hypothetical protein [Streptomyces sp. NBC_00091]|uniref:hypothetical protein n=1 Tax=Streptomyces sp. NBC_00091 TaxID=2975648 RepID=UPI00224D10AC|nr:hypothetical protein [Streptomyces sp. NBC_00091]MCX5375122.1 hypothetical protein [Streptomyces sp. NBC_00091]
MRIRHSLVLILAAATLVTGCGSGGQEATPRMWEPDDALQRADKGLGKGVGDGRVTMRGTSFLASGLDKTLEAGGEGPYRFDIACDSEDSPRVTLVLSREGGSGERSFDVACGTVGEVTRLNFPAGAALSAHIEPAPQDDSPPAGVLSWQLLTLDPASVQGCPDALAGCPS